jgi:hypothetical protein
MIRLLAARLHGIIDSIVGAFLLLTPNLFGFAGDGTAMSRIPPIVGIIVLVQAMLTRWGVGIFPKIPLSFHRIMDFVLGLFLAASSWQFGFADRPARGWAPHVFVGLAIFLQALMMNPHPAPVAYEHDPHRL